MKLNMNETTKKWLKICLIVAAIFLYLDLLTTLIGLRIGLFESNPYSVNLLMKFGSVGFILITALIVNPFVLFGYVLLFPFLANALPDKLRFKEPLIRILLCLGAFLVSYISFLSVANNLNLIFRNI